MSVEAMAVVLHHSKAKGTAKLVLVGIANHDGDGGAWPSIHTLARYANVADRNVIKAVQSLQAIGEITVDRQAGGPPNIADTRRPNLYRVLVCCPPWCDRTAQHRDTRSKQPALWKTPLTPASPPDASVTPPPDASVTPPPDASVTLTVHRTQPENVVVLPQVSTGRARRDPLLEPCGICGQTRERCVARSAVHDMGHLFEPTWDRRKGAHS